jgi:serine/threonine-protein kinase
MPVEAADRVGSVIDGRYKILEVMASGAMGSVYKAERVPVGKLVAIKFLHASFASDSEFQTRFDRETRVMSKLNHPNCVSVVDFGVWEGAPYLAMDYVDGITLRKRMDDVGPMPPEKALAIARQIISGLAHAHQQEIFHRDVKPANIMISQEIGHGERVRLLDFGLARLQGNVGRDATQTNMVVGTPNYMAPEQTVPGSTVDARTDLYAVGVIIYEMIVGDRPFIAEDTMQLLGMHRAAPIPRLADRLKEGTEIPRGLQDLIDKAMAKSPKARFQTTIAITKAIDQVLARRDETDIDVTLPKQSREMIGNASTVASMQASDINAMSLAPPRKRSFARTLVMLMILVGGSAAMAGYLIKRNKSNASKQRVVAVERDAAIVVAADASVSDVATPPVVVDAATIDAVEIDAAAPADASVDLGDAGIDEEEIQIDPAQVEDPDTEAGSAAPPEDEEKDAPQTTEEVEKREPPAPAPALARTVHDAVLLIKSGKKALALASLHALYKKQPNSGYIPFLLGNLYFDKTWWSVSMDYYRTAIKKNAGYRNNAVLNRNVIRMLASTKTRQTATNFLRGVIGRPSVPYLKYAAAHEQNPIVRKQAATVARLIR